MKMRQKILLTHMKFFSFVTLCQLFLTFFTYYFSTADLKKIKCISTWQNVKGGMPSRWTLVDL